MYADANGIRIHYRIDGREGAPWVTFITGIASDTTMWLSAAGCTPEEVGYNLLQAVAPRSGPLVPYGAYQAERENLLAPSPTPTNAWRRPAN